MKMTQKGTTQKTYEVKHGPGGGDTQGHRPSLRKGLSGSLTLRKVLRRGR